ncbi:MAG: response regulator transcription factor, partial [Chloroflexi bacterium]|nr:response regulator transcription factor [Chloroflexota bacterium]
MSDVARVLLVDDHAIVRLGLRTLLESHPDVRVVGEAGSAAEALEMVEQLQPAIVILDIKLPGTSGIEACRQIKAHWPQVNVIMLTSFEQDEMVSQAIQAGAVGYVLKQVGTEE